MLAFIGLLEALGSRVTALAACATWSDLSLRLLSAGKRFLNASTSAAEGPGEQHAAACAPLAQEQAEAKLEFPVWALINSPARPIFSSRRPNSNARPCCARAVALLIVLLPRSSDSWLHFGPHASLPCRLPPERAAPALSPPRTIGTNCAVVPPSQLAAAMSYNYGGTPQQHGSAQRPGSTASFASQPQPPPPYAGTSRAKPQRTAPGPTDMAAAAHPAYAHNPSASPPVPSQWPPPTSQTPPSQQHPPWAHAQAQALPQGSYNPATYGLISGAPYAQGPGQPLPLPVRRPVRTERRQRLLTHRVLAEESDRGPAGEQAASASV